MIELNGNNLVFQFPEIHEDAVCRVSFQRTLRIPDDNREYPLPPGLGRFPMEHVEDHASRLPEEWVRHGGVLLPMYQSEALWMSFSSDSEYPFALKIAAGKINAVTGEAWTNDLSAQPQDYLVVPKQPWLDGFCVQKGLIRQFVAMPLGQGYTAEEQLTGQAQHGGLQIVAYPMKRSHYEKLMKARPPVPRMCYSMPMSSSSMGLAPGGLMRQKIYKDSYGMEAWDTNVSSRCFVHILNSGQWAEATGKGMLSPPVSASEYTTAGLPWFEYYDDSLTPLGGSQKLAGLDSVAAKSIKQGESVLKENPPVHPANVQKLGPGSMAVKDGGW
ncbi:MAG: hypothetical protein Q7T32_09885 [Moraxellaceae bacterium]|nr:hypothetical protein [Moraxellaceae bacterium]